MGLRLNFELRLHASTAASAAHAMLAELHVFANTVQLASASPFLSPATVDSQELRERLEALQHWVSIVTAPLDDDPTSLTSDESSALGFFVDPGGGCESASFGLLRRYSAQDRALSGAC